MRIPTNKIVNSFIESKEYSNPQPTRSTVDQFVRFCNTQNITELESKTISEMINEYFNSSHAKKSNGKPLATSTITKNRGILLDLCTYAIHNSEIPTFEGKHEIKEKELSQAVEKIESGLSTKSIEAQQEALRASELLAEKQSEQLEKTRLENIEKMQQLEAQKLEAQRLEAIREAQELKAKQEARIKKRFSNFVSEEIPETFVKFNVEENIPESASEYFQQKGEKTTFFALMDMGKHIVLTGQAGVGKTELALLYAKTTETPVFKYSCSADTRKNDLIGSKTITKEEEVKIVCGMLAKTIVAGNKFGRAMLILDEGNALISKIQILLQGCTDSTRFLDLPEGKLKINEGVKFNVVITQNDLFSGTNPLNKPIVNRFAFIEMDRLSTDTKMKIFKGYNVAQEIKDKLCTLDDKLNEMQSEMKISDQECMSVRSMKAILEQIEEWQFLDMPNAIQTALETQYITKFSDIEDRVEIQKVIDNIF
tara:strand:- start:148 stop:1593 length:1446 start_codon:yes stop_codon:yes gene_type:complete